MELKPIIMVVDDEPQIGQMLTRFLGKHNYGVIYFTSGKKALDYLQSNSAVRDCHALNHNGSGLAMTSKGCHCEERSDEAISTSNGVHLLLTDMQMPEISGLELVRQVKILYPALPIIVMSGSADGQDRDEIFKLGADFITKPLDFADLLKQVNSRLLWAGADASSTCPKCGHHKLLNRNYCFKCEKAILGGRG
ncbi:MAG: response regulator [Planctomycetota bacterium]